MRVFRLALLLLMAAPSVSGAQTTPLRIVSLNACVDQFLIKLADRGQIAALSNYARDPTFSFYAKEAQALPVSSGTVEEVLALEPDLIIAGTSRRQLLTAQLRKRGLRVVEIAPADSYRAIAARTREIATLVGHGERGEELIAKMD